MGQGIGLLGSGFLYLGLYDCWPDAQLSKQNTINSDMILNFNMSKELIKCIRYILTAQNTFRLINYSLNFGNSF